MRDLIISLILFLLMISAITANSVYISNEGFELLNIIEEIPSADNQNCLDFIEIYEKRWVKFKRIASISLCYTEIAGMDCLIAELKCHYSTQNVHDFEYVKTVMKQSIKSMIRFEKLSLNGIM